jgi:hypothetical protein
LLDLPVLLLLATLVLLPNARTQIPVALGQQPVDYRAIQWHVPANLDEAEAYARLALSRLPPNAVVFAQWKQHFTLAYVAEFEAGRRDLLFTRIDHFAREEAVRRYAATRPLYFVESPARWIPVEVLGRVVSEPPLYVLVRG